MQRPRPRKECAPPRECRIFSLSLDLLVRGFLLFRFKAFKASREEEKKKI